MNTNLMYANRVRRFATIPDTTSSPTSAPVFLHTGWRTAGTWLWSRFREIPGTHCFYEPLHEALAGLSQDEIARVSSNSWASGHPALTRPYYHEYAGLLNADGIGVRQYRKAFAIDRLLCPPEMWLAGLRDYLGGLIVAARENDAVPVLKFCRSTGRMAWMRRNFPQAVHVAVLRNPASQWASARRPRTVGLLDVRACGGGRIECRHYDTDPGKEQWRHHGVQQFCLLAKSWRHRRRFWRGRGRQRQQHRRNRGRLNNGIHDLYSGRALPAGPGCAIRIQPAGTVSRCIGCTIGPIANWPISPPPNTINARTGLWTRGLLIRRNIADGDLVFFSTWCRAGTGIETLVKVEGHRWAEVVKVPPAGRWNTTGGD
jgi:hypothetical protein